MTQAAVLVLENGRVFHGQTVGPEHETVGEVVFNTSLSGYQEILSDPSYAGQIVVMTAPHIGNTGVNADDMESSRVSCAGLAMREASPIASNWRSQGSLQEFLGEHKVPGIDGIDTRALTRALREEGAMRGAISTAVDDIEGIVSRVKAAPLMKGQDLASKVTCEQSHQWKEGIWTPPEFADQVKLAPEEFSVVAYDFGIKSNILRDLRSLGCSVTVLPAKTPAKEALALKPDGFFLSNGPGDPAALGYAVETVAELASGDTPLFGICLGHQLLSLALGAKTYKLRFGHHGGNHPVMDLETRKVEITSQNHGFAVDADSLPEGVTCTHINLYDETVEGIAISGKPVFGIQYHPEASPGPRDASYLFRRFTDAMRSVL